MPSLHPHAKEAVCRQTQSTILRLSRGDRFPTGPTGGSGGALLDKLRRTQATLSLQVADLSTQVGPSISQSRYNSIAN